MLLKAAQWCKIVLNSYFHVLDLISIGVLFKRTAWNSKIRLLRRLSQENHYQTFFLGHPVLELVAVAYFSMWLSGWAVTRMRSGEVVSLHDLCLKYSSCFFASFPLGHFIIDNICHRLAAALFDVRKRRWSRQNYFWIKKTLTTVQEPEKRVASQSGHSSHTKWWPNIFRGKFDASIYCFAE